MSAKRICKDAILTAIALVAFMVENLFPPLLFFAPGAKLGLSNDVALITLIIVGAPDAFVVIILKCTLGAVFAGNPFSLVYSLPSALASIGVQTALYLTLFPRISLMAISLTGATAFNIVQLSIASLVAGVNMLPLLPLMLAASVVAGAAVGLIAFLTVRFLPRSVCVNDFRERRIK